VAGAKIKRDPGKSSQKQMEKPAGKGVWWGGAGKRDNKGKDKVNNQSTGTWGNVHKLGTIRDVKHHVNIIQVAGLWAALATQMGNFGNRECCSKTRWGDQA